MTYLLRIMLFAVLQTRSDDEHVLIDAMKTIYLRIKNTQLLGMFILVLVYTLNVNSVHGYILSNQLLSISVFVWRKTFSYRVEL